MSSNVPPSISPFPGRGNAETQEDTPRMSNTSLSDVAPPNQGARSETNYVRWRTLPAQFLKQWQCMFPLRALLAKPRWPQ